VKSSWRRPSQKVSRRESERHREARHALQRFGDVGVREAADRVSRDDVGGGVIGALLVEGARRGIEDLAGDDDPAFALAVGQGEGDEVRIRGRHGDRLHAGGQAQIADFNLRSAAR
jgi:hypothetical protein